MAVKPALSFVAALTLCVACALACLLGTGAQAQHMPGAHRGVGIATAQRVMSVDDFGKPVTKDAALSAQQQLQQGRGGPNATPLRPDADPLLEGFTEAGTAYAPHAPKVGSIYI